MRDSLMQYVLSTILICIPEMCVIGFTSLSILKSLSNIKVNKVKTIILIFAPAIIMNIPEVFYFSRIHALFFAIFIEIIFVCSISIKRNLTSKEFWVNVGYVVLSVLGGILFFLITEGIFGLSAIKALGLKSEDFANDTILAFGVSSPERVAQFTLIFIISISQVKMLISKNAIKVKVLEEIRTSKTYRRNLILSTAFSILWNAVLLYACSEYNILAEAPVLFGIIFMTLAIFVSLVPLLVLVSQVYRNTVNSSAEIRYITNNIRTGTMKALAHASVARNTNAISALRDVINDIDTIDKAI